MRRRPRRARPLGVQLARQPETISRVVDTIASPLSLLQSIPATSFAAGACAERQRGQQLARNSARASPATALQAACWCSHSGAGRRELGVRPQEAKQRGESALKPSAACHLCNLVCPGCCVARLHCCYSYTPPPPPPPARRPCLPLQRDGQERHANQGQPAALARQHRVHGGGAACSAAGGACCAWPAEAAMQPQQPPRPHPAPTPPDELLLHLHGQVHRRGGQVHGRDARTDQLRHRGGERARGRGHERPCCCSSAGVTIHRIRC